MSQQANTTKQTPRKTISPKAFIAFMVSLVLCSLLISMTIKNKAHIEKMNMERLIVGKSAEITNIVSKLLYKAQILSALIVQDNGDTRNFDRLATLIASDSSILNIILAPNGVISKVYPLPGNEKLIGYNLLGQGPGNKEAILAKESGQLVFGGPFNLIQGGQGLVGRYPIWLETPDGRGIFWGLVNVTLAFPQALENAGLSSLERQGFSYEIWRISPDTGEKQIIAENHDEASKKNDFIEEKMQILNATWHFRIYSVQSWYQHSENWLLILAGLCISILTGVVMQNNHTLKIVTCELEESIRKDPLTGLLNRKGLIAELEKLLTKGTKFALNYIDLNYFKQMNDQYGHNAGDYVLTEFSQRVTQNLDEEIIFARISGDEFVIIIPEHLPQKANVWEKIYKNFDSPIYETENEKIMLTFSRGTAHYPKDALTIDDLISCADKYMYEQKNEKYAAEKKRRRCDI